MCRNIKTLFNFDPPATDEEIRAASVQFVRKLSGFTQPSKANETVFNSAVDDVANVARRLIDSLVTTASPRDREEWAARARARAADRFEKRAGSRPGDSGRRASLVAPFPAASANRPGELTTAPGPEIRHP
jgi:hypothetical protein